MQINLTENNYPIDSSFLDGLYECLCIKTKGKAEMKKFLSRLHSDKKWLLDKKTSLIFLSLKWIWQETFIDEFVILI